MVKNFTKIGYFFPPETCRGVKIWKIHFVKIGGHDSCNSVRVQFHRRNRSFTRLSSARVLHLATRIKTLTCTSRRFACSWPPFCFCPSISRSRQSIAARQEAPKFFTVPHNQPCNCRKSANKHGNQLYQNSADFLYETHVAFEGNLMKNQLEL